MSTDVSGPLRRSYSEEEIGQIYEVGRLCMENGLPRRTEKIMLGLVEVAPDFLPGWLGVCLVHYLNKNLEAGLSAARQAVKLSPSSPEALLFLVIFLLNTGDFNTAGTYLGEIRERIESGLVEDPNIIKLYKAQTVRFQLRER
jgi:hypothetical protein